MYSRISQEIYRSDYRSERHALLRRECRGLVVHRSGGVLARPLHKFFLLDQIPETNAHQLELKDIACVTKKLDGQMVYGLLVGGAVEFWTRSGPTEVGSEARRVALSSSADYLGFVELICSWECTPVFEYVGKRSHKKAFEGNFSRLILLAVRFSNGGAYWEHHAMQDAAGRFGVPVVQRLPYLEHVGIYDILARVRMWHNSEGVVVQFSDHTWVMLGEDQVGLVAEDRVQQRLYFTSRGASQVQEEQARLRARKDRLQHHSLRLVVVDPNFDTRPTEIKEWFPGCKQVQMVYGHSGRLRLAVVGFSTKARRDEALHEPENSHLRLQPAYSHRTRTCARHRVDTFCYVGDPSRGSTSSP